MTTVVNVTAPGVGHDPLGSGSKVARSSAPFLPKTHLRPMTDHPLSLATHAFG